MLSQNVYYDYYLWAWKIVTSFALAPELHSSWSFYAPETGSTKMYSLYTLGSTIGTNNKVKQRRDWACWLFQGQISVTPFVDLCLYKKLNNCLSFNVVFWKYILIYFPRFVFDTFIINGKCSLEFSMGMSGNAGKVNGIAAALVGEIFGRAGSRQWNILRGG